jgi:hypothetical protein
MAMYTQLLGAASAERPPPVAGISESDAVDEVLRCRRALAEGVPAEGDSDTVPAVLALQIAYDVSLLELAGVLGIDSDPSRFEQPQLERERLERAFGARGLNLEVAVDVERSVSERS